MTIIILAQVSVFSENGTTYFYHPEEAVSSQLSTGGVAGGSVLLPQWSAYSGTPAHIVAMIFPQFRAQLRARKVRQRQLRH